MHNLFGHFRHYYFLLLLTIATGLIYTTHAHTANIKEDTAKALFIRNIAKFTDWPEGALSDNHIELCLIQGRHLSNDFFKLQQSHIRGRYINVSIVREIYQLEHCNIVFIGGTERNQLPQIFAAVEKRPILTIGEMFDFAVLGGMINVTHNPQGKIDFIVNLTALRQVGLNISSRILRLATIVNKE